MATQDHVALDVLRFRIVKTPLTVKYLGGHPAHEKPANNVSLYLDDDGLNAKHSFRSIMRFGWDEITDVIFEGPDEVEKRVTITRLVGLGLFAFAAKKKSKGCFITVITKDGEAIFESEKLTALEARAKLQPALRNLTT